MDATLRYASPGPYTHTNSWTYQMPSQPRVVIPCPNINETSSLDLPIGEGIQFDFKSSGFTNSEFLHAITYGDSMVPNNRLDWKYGWRKNAQRILPFLYLGPFTAARDPDFLRSEGITMVMAVRNTMSAQAKLLNSKVAADLGIQTVSIDVASNQELIAAFPRTIEAINLHLSTLYRQQQNLPPLGQGACTPTVQRTSGKVLVFCESGNERSAAVVAAYIMAMYSINLIKTIHIIQGQRFCCSLDDSLKVLLQTFEAILCARRDVSKSDVSQQTRLEVPPEEVGNKATSSKLAGKASKRTLDQAYDVEMDTGDGYDQMDRGRFERREGYAPFEDG